MRCERLRHLLVGVLAYVHGVFVVGAAPASSTDLRLAAADTLPPTCDGGLDLASRTVRADIVVDARAGRSLRLRGGDGGSDDRRPYDVVFAVNYVLKGSLPATDVGDDEQLFTAGIFLRRGRAGTTALPAPTRTEGVGEVEVSAASDGADDVGCASTSLPKNGSRFFVFLRRTDVLPMDSKSSGAIRYRISDSPEPFSEEGLRTVRKLACDKCVREPRVRLKPDRDVTLVSGQKLRLSCRASGLPMPTVVTWYKDGRLLTSSSSDKRVKINANRQNARSRLEISKVKVADAGRYQCEARSVAGVSQRATTVLQVRDPETSTKPHARLCTDQTYCLNGGTCYVLESLDQQLCECKSSFLGRRCQEKRIAQAVVGKDGTNNLSLLSFLSQLRRSGRLRDVAASSQV